MKLDDLKDMMIRSFDHHVDGLAVAQANGVTILPSDKLKNTQTIFLVSQSAYDALVARSAVAQ